MSYPEGSFSFIGELPYRIESRGPYFEFKDIQIKKQEPQAHNFTMGDFGMKKQSIFKRIMKWIT